MRVLAAMSGGVDSSVAAAMLKAEGHQVVGATMKLWGGRSDSGCCSIADVDDARRVAQQLGIDHHVFNFTEEFSSRIVDHYVGEHMVGHTPNPCIECNRHIKFDRLLERARILGFDAVATGHHARVMLRHDGRFALVRGVDVAKDQSYVLHMLRQHQLRGVLFPIGSLTKAEVRDRARDLQLRTAGKPDSQDVCFITKKGGRESFLGERIPLRPATVVDESGSALGTLPALELVTVGQRRGLGPLGVAPDGGADPLDRRRYVVALDRDAARVTVGPLSALMVQEISVDGLSWVDAAPRPADALLVQTSAHGRPLPARWSAGRGAVVLEEPARRVAPGQSVVLYREDEVVGGGTAR
jgi:tRNA-uridine 2-sulfurtransferase